MKFQSQFSTYVHMYSEDAYTKTELGLYNQTINSLDEYIKIFKPKVKDFIESSKNAFGYSDKSAKELLDSDLVNIQCTFFDGEKIYTNDPYCEDKRFYAIVAKDNCESLGVNKVFEIFKPFYLNDGLRVFIDDTDNAEVNKFVLFLENIDECDDCGIVPVEYFYFNID